eukprot:TRINITY_DN51470_c0_g1_i2.p4 TRINITY_DN51470_c0_g1~~TRINITY_DN51470_c0_g1_i2.p4  ORF type:complete len:124 (-),score=21.89 TRINITY_DN51470_c0_g1_i2:60-431(-)
MSVVGGSSLGTAFAVDEDGKIWGWGKYNDFVFGPNPPPKGVWPPGMLVEPPLDTAPPFIAVSCAATDDAPFDDDEEFMPAYFLTKDGEVWGWDDDNLVPRNFNLGVNVQTLMPVLEGMWGVGY